VEPNLSGNAHPGGTARTTSRRLPDKAVTDVDALNAVLDAGLVAHVAVVDESGQPFVLPCAYARHNDRLLLHGSSASRLFRALASGAPTCVTITLLDGLVLARSAFESSMNYRSVMVFGQCEVLDGEKKLAALERLSEHLLPGRWSDIRPPSKKELAATLVLSLPVAECSVKVSAGPPEDAPEDIDRPVWAGVVPVVQHFGEPVAAPDIRFDIEIPGYVEGWRR
jgi:nitroimidazol reductase NimA-like FMN-containing flavoprotein (pyridoxamine 5'-phosphate oxidase superfamily)